MVRKVLRYLPNSSNIRGYLLTYPWIFHHVTMDISLRIHGYASFSVLKTCFSGKYFVTIRSERLKFGDVGSVDNCPRCDVVSLAICESCLIFSDNGDGSVVRTILHVRPKRNGSIEGLSTPTLSCRGRSPRPRWVHPVSAPSPVWQAPCRVRQG